MGRRPTNPATKKAKGTEQPCRAVTSLYPDHAARPDPEVIDPPKWLSRLAKVIWKSKVERYRQRKQKIDGFQDVLAQYCSLEADLVAGWKMGRPANASLMNSYKDFAARFYDSPADQNVVIGASSKKKNKFSGRGKR